MACKVIQLSIPVDKRLPEEIHTFSPEENFQLIKIGTECLLEGRKVVAGLTQKEIYEKIKEETKEEIQKRDMELILEREMSKKMEERVSLMYQGQLEQFKKQIEVQKDQLRIYETENKEFLQKHLEKEREKYDLLLNEKEKRVENMKELFDKSLKAIENKSVFKSMKHKGDAGENTFNEIAYEAFKDFNGFDIKNVSAQSHCGDFHLDFQDFSVLVDVKHYKNSVPIKEIQKIQSDFNKNSNFHFAWLISLDTKIDKHDRGVLMFECIEGSKYICYINELLKQKNPIEFLKSLYFICKELYKEENKDDYDDSKEKMAKEAKYFKTIERIKLLRKNVFEVKKTIETLKASCVIMENSINDILNEDVSKIAEDYYSLISSWWEKNYESCETEELLHSKDIWLKFKRENSNIENLDVVKFKKILCEILPENMVVSSNGKNPGIDIKNMKLREIITIVTEKTQIKKKKKPVEEEAYTTEEYIITKKENNSKTN
jgi:hypothetical protein